MDIITLDSDTYDNGKIINGIDSVLWVERYRDPGDFTIIGDPSGDFLKDLAIGKIVSHSDTYDMMIVENHEIDETVDGPRKVKITGRSLSWYIMEGRVAQLYLGQGFVDHPTTYVLAYHLAEAELWDQIVTLLHDMVVDSTVDISGDIDIPNLSVYTTIALTDPDPNEHYITPMYLSEAVNQLLTIYDMGIRVERPNHAHSTTMDWIVHGGDRLESSVKFSWLEGDFDDARYLWSNKGYRNRAYAKSKYYGNVTTIGSPTPLGMREMLVDLNSAYPDYLDPSDPDFPSKPLGILSANAKIALNAANMVSIVDAKISKNSQYQYRQNYKLGDVVYVVGNYGIAEPMRVTEYAESLDDTGKSGYPTLSAVVL